MTAVRPTILVVDDDAAIRELVAEVLALEGYGVVAASTVPAALLAFDQHAPPAGDLRVVLLDLHLHGTDGTEVLRRVEARGGATAVVFMTGNADREDIAAREGRPVIAKPFDLDELLAVVAAHCANASC